MSDFTIYIALFPQWSHLFESKISLIFVQFKIKKNLLYFRYEKYLSDIVHYRHHFSASTNFVVSVDCARHCQLKLLFWNHTCL